MKKQKGITLIALIITIIVMLILVGVTINVALNGGLFQKADDAKNLTQLALDKEELQIAVVSALNNDREIPNAQAIKNNLSNGWTVTGPDGGPYICTSSKGNIFTVDKEGSVTEGEINSGGNGVEPIDQDLKRYILGPAETGRPITEIATTTDGKTFTLLDDELTPDVDETETLNVQFLIGVENEDASKLLGYIKYENEVYKVIIDAKTYRTEENGLTLEYTPKEFEGEDLGEVTGDSSYNGWTILYNNGNTLEAVSPQAMGELRLGYSETATDEATRLTEAIDSYNNVITTINDYCKNELTGLPINSNVRSIGESSETNEYYSDIPDSWNSAYNGVGKKGDTLYSEDFIRMVYYGVVATGKEYWLPSRQIRDYSTQDSEVYFDVRYILSDGTPSYRSLWRISGNGADMPNAYTQSVRPIITVQTP